MILEKIKKANDIKKVDPKDYGILAEEIRKRIIDTVSHNGGHLSSSLGVVELTMALHLTLNFPEDKVLWDVGHQSYAHKILTGRNDNFDTLRTEGGISGFPSRDENECDAFGMGHSSTSVSAALGFAKARDLKGGNNHIVAVIGDGALTGGMVYEALNNMDYINGNMIIILNDNEMSISRNVGGVSKVLNNLRTDRKYNDLKFSVKNRLSKIPGYGDELIGKIHKTKSSIKQFFVPGMIFEDMGITYLGPVDGHDINKLIKIINMAKRVNHGVLIHVHTTKGKGYAPAEHKPSFYHGVMPFDAATGNLINNTQVRTYSDVLSAALIKNAENDNRIIAITAAMAEGTGLKRFEKKFPDRFFDVGIAEEHAVTFAAGLAAEGFKPYFAVYSSFLQRGFDQVLHDVCIQKLPVRFIIERAGIVGSDGITHQGIFDLSYMNIIPGMTVMAPKNRFELRDMIDFSVDFEGPLAIRFPKGKASEIYRNLREPIVYGKSEVLKQGKDVALIGVGLGVEIADKVADGLNAAGIIPTVINARFVKPIDEELITALSKDHKLIVTIEENVLKGGYGMNVLQFVNENELPVKVYPAAFDDEFIEHGDSGSLRKKHGLGEDDILDEIKRRLNR